MGNPHIEPIIVRRCEMTEATRSAYETDLKNSGVSGENIRHLLTFMEYYQVRARQIGSRSKKARFSRYGSNKSTEREHRTERRSVRPQFDKASSSRRY